MATRAPSNQQIAALLDRIGDHLAAKEENPFRVRSYRTAASAVRLAKVSLGAMVKKNGSKALLGLQGVGEKIAGLIEEYVTSGSVEMLKSLESEVKPEQLEKVAEDRKIHAPAIPRGPLPKVGLILEIDSEYLQKARQGKLKKIAPKLLNPERKAWLPILASSRSGWKFTVMFSNTATAHKLGKTGDWVVVYAEKGDQQTQCTVVSEHRGELKDKRVIRGREGECREYYRSN
ncbi:MAG TPA: helix-hairpin-helix domain-containing protein [Bacteroidota bacterium]|nr:helix-hairpin-helix domain-containing protein [Bacteroidota bacterium]